MYDFDDIRPYHDHEVRAVLDTLLEDQELAKALAKFKLPRLYRNLPGLTTKATQWWLRHEVRHVNTVHDFQIIIEKYLDKLIESTTDGLTTSGLDKLDPNASYLFISNHRDITLDPALVNYFLYHSTFDTVQIAIGDNLLKRPFLTHLMKLNKSFIVKRSLEGREKLKASKQLSAYIHHCVEGGQNVWIAQREGRAKDGIDKTESAVITMLHLVDRDPDRNRSLHASMNALNIVPVSISYEIDPCDAMKATELHAIDTQGRFEKDEHSDVKSILNGMVGEKGSVHVAFGQPLRLNEAATTEGVAEMIDEQIIANYRLHLMNYLAMELLQPRFMDFSTLRALFGVSEERITRKREQLNSRLQGMAPELRQYVLEQYANPVIRKAENRHRAGAA